MHWVYLMVAIVAEIGATSCMKSTDGFTRLAPSLVSISGYCVSFYLLALALRSIPVGIAYALWSGVGIVFIALIGWLVFGQKLDTPAVVGLGLILSGVLVINLFSSSVTH